MLQVSMKVVSKPDHSISAVIEPTSLPVFTGNGSIDYLCGNCGKVIAKGMLEGTKFSDIVILCTCGSYNEMLRGGVTMRETLKNKPLIEAIFELRWELQEISTGVRIDPNYKILVGGIYSKIRDKYPYRESLPTANMPDEISGYVVQHRFRKGQDEWPLIQIGPGIITLNDTDNYAWKDFEERISHMIGALSGTYTEKEELKVNGLLLRYIDAIDFDYEDRDIFKFLKSEMKINIDIKENLFEGTGVGRLPRGFDLRFSFPATEPRGIIQLRFTRGRRREKDALVWETMVQSIGDDVPELKDKIPAWVEAAHNLTRDWFFKIIAGNLYRRFE